MDDRAEARSGTKMAQIGDQSVGNIQHRMSETDKPRPERDPRPRQAIAVEQEFARSGIETRPDLAFTQGEPQPAIAERARDIDRIAFPSAAAQDRLAGSNLADQHRREQGRARVAA